MSTKTNRLAVVAEKAKETASIELNGKTYGIAFDFNQIVRTEYESGANLLHAMNNIANLSALQLRGLLLAGVRAVDPDTKLTLADVGAGITFDSIIPLTDSLAKSIIATMSEKAA